MYNKFIERSDTMKSYYFEYKENDDIHIKSNEGNFITFLGDLNDYLLKRMIFLEENDYLTFAYSKITKKYVDKYYKQIGFASYELINILDGETVLDELAFGLESLAYKVEDIKKETEKMLVKFNLDKEIDKNPLSLCESKKAMLLIASALITKPKLLVLDNILSSLDKSDEKIVKKVLREFVKNKGIVLNFTNNVDESLLGEEIIITNKEKIIVNGKTMSVLNEEKIMKRLGIGLPFIVLLNKYLKDYELITDYELDYKKLGGKLWK